MSDDRIRDSLNELMNAAARPNPLEVLGVSSELAKELGPDALLVAVKGLYRAHQLQLHPDRTVSRAAENALSTRLQRVQDAYESINPDNIEGLRARITKTKKAKSRKLPQENSIPREKTPAISKNKALRYIDSLQSDESILHIKKANLVVRPFSLLPQDNQLPLLDILLEEEGLRQSKLQLFNDVEIPQQLDSLIKPDELTQAFNITDEQDDRNGWYIVRGQGDSRSVQHLRPTAQEDISGNIVGVIDQEAAQSSLREFYGANNSRMYKRDELISGRVEKGVPKSWGDRFRIQQGWSKFTVGDKDNYVLYPFIEKDMILVTREGDDLVIIGRVEQILISYT